ncbi:TPA: hypothetical protein HA251_00900 [Candidatus Woesearchaeota archaeon]|nr:hypothetical protein [Candidatus Woesearchaeota archaeon]
MNPLVFLPVMLLLVGCKVSDQAGGHRLSREEAILAAELFIRDNGYTESSVSPEAILANEGLERYSDREKKLAFRHNTLQPNAVGAKLTGDVWTVGFAYTDSLREKYPASGRPTGRAVRFDAEGNNMQVMHKDLFLDILE